MALQVDIIKKMITVVCNKKTQTDAVIICHFRSMPLALGILEQFRDCCQLPERLFTCNIIIGAQI